MNIKQTIMGLGLACFASLAVLAQKPIKVACVGNSITAGFLLKDPKTESYPSRLQQMLGSEYEVGNFGLSGATLLSDGHRPYIKTEEFQKAVAFDADIVIVHLGLNDTDPRNWPNFSQNFKRDYLRLLDTLGINKPGKKFYIAEMSPLLPAHRRYYASSRDWFQEVNQAIRNISKTKFYPQNAQGKAEEREITLLNFSEPFDARWHLFPDALHPNAEGAQLLAEYVYKSLKGQQAQPITLHPYYRDNMIIQRGEVKVQGRATAGHTISYQAGKAPAQKVRVDATGRFEMKLDCRKYGSFDLRITNEDTNESRLIRNIQVGEVWVASGQSNMAMTLRETKEFDLDKAPADELLQYVDMPIIAKTDNDDWSMAILDSVNAFQYYGPYRFWTAKDKSSLGSWSAVAYHFARKLRDSLNCPVAIIHNAVGGSPIESWLDPNMLERKYPDVVCNWLDKEYAQPWVKERTKKNITNRPKEQTHPYAPGYLYVAGWEPIAEIPHRGAIWYQGESNAHAPELYEAYFKELVATYQKAQVADKQANVYAVQLSSINRPSWVYFRTRQAQPAELYVPSYDLGDSLDVHPQRKAAIGNRLALRALERTYKRPFKSDAPQVAQVKAQVKSNSIDIQVQLSSAWGGIKSADGQALYGFELMTNTGKVIKATQIELVPSQTKGKATLLLKNLPLERYISLSYAAEPFTRANVMAGNGMPLLPVLDVAIQY